MSGAEGRGLAAPPSLEHVVPGELREEEMFYRAHRIHKESETPLGVPRDLPSWSTGMSRIANNRAMEK